MKDYKDNIQEAITEISDMASLKEILESYGIELDSNNKALCPFHDEKTPSFCVYESQGKAYYKCHGCGEGGDIINLVMKMENLGFIDAVKKAYKILNIDTFNLGFNFKNSPKKISLDAGLEALIKTKKNNPPNGFVFEDYYLYTDKQGEVNAIKLKYRNLETNKKDMRMLTISTNEQGKKEVLYKDTGADNITKEVYNVINVTEAIKEHKPVIIVEGEKDADTLNTLGFCATTFYSLKAKDLKNNIVNTFKNSDIILIGDTGKAGEEFISNTFDNLKNVVKTIRIPKLPGLIELGDNKDITDWLEAGNTKEKLLKAIKETKFEVLEQWEYGNTKYFYNGFNTYEQQAEDEARVIYAGKFAILGTKWNIDTKEETLLIESTRNYENTIIEVTLKVITDITELKAISDTKGVLFAPNTLSRIQHMLYIQYLSKEKQRSLLDSAFTNKLGFIEFDNKINFIYPGVKAFNQCDITFNEKNKTKKSFTYKGDFDSSVDLILKPILKTDCGKFLVSTCVTSLIKPLFPIYENWLVDFYGGPGKGKTTALLALASLFGNPKEYISQWRSTSNAVLLKATMLGSFPNMIDDTKKRVSKKSLMSDIYALSDGKEKDKAEQSGKDLQESRIFNNLTISTGETSIQDYNLSETSGAGIQGRIISISNDDYGIFTCKEEADKIELNMQNHYGTIGQELCKYLDKLFRNKTTLNKYINLYENLQSKFCSKVKNQSSIRKARNLALTSIAYKVLIEFLASKNKLTEKEYIQLINCNFFEEFLIVQDREAEQLDIYRNAYMEICHYVLAEKSLEFKNNSDYKNSRGWVDKDKNKAYIIDTNFIKERLNDFADCNLILKEWKNRGYLKSNKDRFTLKATIPFGDKARANVFCINLDFYDKELDLSENTDFLEEVTKEEEIRNNPFNI